MLWINLAVLSYFLTAVVNIFDKYIVTDTKLKPISYTFYSGIFQISYVVLIPFIAFTLPSNAMATIGILNGALFILTLLIFYKALKVGEASRVIPVVGASIPIFTASLAYIILNESLRGTQLAAFSLLVLGGALISSQFKNGKIYAIKGLALSMLAGFLFALYFTLLKLLYNNSDFLSGFFLIQIGGFLGSAALLILKKNRREIYSIRSGGGKKSNVMFVFAKITAAIAAIILNYAISIEGSKITIINSLQSVQYIFVIFFAFIISKKIPKIMNEHFSREVMMQKISSIILIGAGLYFLSL